MFDPLLAASPLRSNLRGILWMLIFAFIMSFMWILIRHVSADIHPFVIAFCRNLFGLIAVIPWFIKHGMAPLKTHRLGLLGVRGLLNTISMLAFFMALSITPTAEVTALAFTGPIYATLLAMFFFREAVGIRRWAAILIGFLGTLVVLRPGFEAISTGQLLVIFSAMIWGACLVIIKSIGRTESSVTITTYMSLFMTPLSLVPALFVWQWPSGEQLLWLVGIGVLGGGGQLAMTESLRSADTHVVMPVDFTKLIWVAIIGYLAFGEVPGIYVWLGGTMIFSATAFIAYREHVLGKQIKATPPLS